MTYSNILLAPKKASRWISTVPPSIPCQQSSTVSDRHPYHSKSELWGAPYKNLAFTFRNIPIFFTLYSEPWIGLRHDSNGDKCNQTNETRGDPHSHRNKISKQCKFRKPFKSHFSQFQPQCLANRLCLLFFEKKLSTSFQAMSTYEIYSEYLYLSCTSSGKEELTTVKLVVKQLQGLRKDPLWDAELRPFEALCSSDHHW